VWSYRGGEIRYLKGDKEEEEAGMFERDETET